MALDYGHQKADDDLKALEKKIIAGYTPVKQEITDKITKYLESFKKQDDEKIRQLKNNEITEKEYLDWRAKEVMGTSRWEQLDKVLAKDISNANQIATKMTSGTVADVYALNANFGIYEIEKDTGANISFTLYDKKTVERMIKDDEFPIVPRMDIPKDQRWNAQKINSAMLQGILSGDSIPDIAKRLRGVTDMNISASIRNARTYVTGAENRGRIDSYKYAESLGIQRDQIWLATIDDRTRASHIALDKERVDIGEKFSNGCEYPGDPNGAPEEIYNCRCTLVSCKKGKPFNDVRNVSEEDYEKWKHSKEQKEISHDVEITDNIKDYNLPKEVKDKLPEIMNLKTYNDFDNYFSSYGIKLDTDIASLKAENGDKEIDTVRDFCQKIAVANETYRSEFGDDALSSLKKIVLYDDEETSKGAYYFNIVGENDADAGTIKFRDWNADGRDILHEFAHAMQDSLKDEDSDACLFAKEIAEHVSMDDVVNPKTKWDEYSYEAEKMADAIARAYWSGKDTDVEFVENLKEYLSEREELKSRPEIVLEKFKAVFSDEEMQRFKTLLDDAPNRKLYEMYANEYDVKKGSGECNWRTNTVTVQIEKERVDKGIPEFNTTAHELGHEFDKLLYKNEDIQNNFHFSEIETIKDGCKFSAGYSMNEFNTEMQTLSKSDEFMDALRKDKEALKPLLQPHEFETPEETETFERLMRWYRLSNTQIGYEIFYNELEQKVNTANAIGFQDSIDGMFRGSRGSRGSVLQTIRWGHGDAYYNDNYNNLFYGKEKDLKQTYKDLGFDASNQSKVKDLTRLYGATNEIFANVNSAVTNKGSDLEFFELYMPNYVSEYRRMMEVLNEKK